MAKTVNFKVEIADEKVWSYVSPSCGDPADAPVHEILRWVLEQINFGNWAITEDSKGRASSLTVGLAAAATADELTINELAAKVKSRLQAINWAGVFARAREEGISPMHSDLAEKIRMTATDDAYGNTEIHYAFELLDLLAHIRASTFVFASPPIHGKVGPDVVSLLREATRAYLLGLDGSCIAICRALLEETLQDRVKRAALLDEMKKTTKGQLECLINLSLRNGALDPSLEQQAHAIRKAGNQVLHRTGYRSRLDAWAVLLDTRAIVEELNS